MVLLNQLTVVDVIGETLNEVSNLSQYHHLDMIPTTYVERQFFVIGNLSGKLRNGQKGMTTLPPRILIISMKACNYEFPSQHTLHKKPPSVIYKKISKEIFPEITWKKERKFIFYFFQVLFNALPQRNSSR